MRKASRSGSPDTSSCHHDLQACWFGKSVSAGKAFSSPAVSAAPRTVPAPGRPTVGCLLNEALLIPVRGGIPPTVGALDSRPFSPPACCVSSVDITHLAYLTLKRAVPLILAPPMAPRSPGFSCPGQEPRGHFSTLLSRPRVQPMHRAPQLRPQHRSREQRLSLPRGCSFLQSVGLSLLPPFPTGTMLMLPPELIWNVSRITSVLHSPLLQTKAQVLPVRSGTHHPIPAALWFLAHAGHTLGTRSTLPFSCFR